MVEDINEQVSVAALFENGTVRPYRIKWNDRVYHVKTVHNSWRQKVGATYQHHISVDIDEETTMVLVIDTSDLSWRLARIDMPG